MIIQIYSGGIRNIGCLGVERSRCHRRWILLIYFHFHSHCIPRLYPLPIFINCNALNDRIFIVLHISLRVHCKIPGAGCLPVLLEIGQKCTVIIFVTGIQIDQLPFRRISVFCNGQCSRILHGLPI